MEILLKSKRVLTVLQTDVLGLTVFQDVVCLYVRVVQTELRLGNASMKKAFFGL